MRAVNYGLSIIVAIFCFCLFTAASGVKMKTPFMISFAPTSGSFEGAQLIFIATKKSDWNATLSCQFGDAPLVKGYFDAKSQHFICRVPSHERPEPVKLSILLNGKIHQMTKEYTYTTHGKYDAPVTIIHADRLAERVKSIRNKLPQSVKFCAVIKNGNPPGWIAKIIEGAANVDYFCVPRLQDGIALRRAGVIAPIMILYLTPAEQAPLMLHYNLEPAAYSLAWVHDVSKLLGEINHKLKVHLWIDTGISREGVVPADALPLARAIHQSEKLELHGIATHFCCLGEDDLESIELGDFDNLTALQKDRFDQTVAEIRGQGIGASAILHASSSDGLRYGLTPIYYDMMRIGTMMFENELKTKSNYSWTTKIQQVKTMPKGWCVDYGCDDTFDEDTKVGLISHIPDDSVAYYIRGIEVEKFIDHEVVVVLDLSDLPDDVQAGELVTMTFEGDTSPLDTSYSAPITLYGFR